MTSATWWRCKRCGAETAAHTRPVCGDCGSLSTEPASAYDGPILTATVDARADSSYWGARGDPLVNQPSGYVFLRIDPERRFNYPGQRDGMPLGFFVKVEDLTDTIPEWCAEVEPVSIPDGMSAVDI